MFDLVKRCHRALAVEGVPVSLREQLGTSLELLNEATISIESLTNEAALGEVLDPTMLSQRLAVWVAVMEKTSAVGLDVLLQLLDHRAEKAWSRLLWAVLVALGGVGLGAVFFGLFLRGLHRRTNAVNAHLAAIAAGELTGTLPPQVLSQSDEISDLARSAVDVGGQLRAHLTQMTQAIEELENSGRGLASSSAESASALDQISQGLGQVFELSRRQQGQIVQESQTMKQMLVLTTSSEEAAEQVGWATDGFSEAAHRSQTLSRSTAEESQSTIERTLELSQSGNEGRASLELLSEAIQGVALASSEIQEVTQVILDIAGQSSLLALNAAIEAADAGPAGRASSVVAEEIEKLAQTSSERAREIKSLVSKIEAAVQGTQGAVEGTFHTFEVIQNGIDRVRQSGKSMTAMLEEQEKIDLTVAEQLSRLTISQEVLSSAMAEQANLVASLRKTLGSLETDSQSISLAMEIQAGAVTASLASVSQVKQATDGVNRVIVDLEQTLALFRV